VSKHASQPKWKRTAPEQSVTCLSELDQKVMKKYVTKCKKWVGLGWDKNSKKAVDIAVFLSYDWQEDLVIAQIAKDNLKPGGMLS